MISFIDAIPAGNAVRLILNPPAGATEVRVLRRTADTFTGPDDTGALVVADGDVHVAFDSTGLLNGTEYFYKPYALVSGAWQAGPTRNCTPQASYVDESEYPLLILRARLFEGLKVEMARGTLAHENGAIPVLLASPTFEDAKWPIVTLQMAGSDSAPERFIGDFTSSAYDDAAAEWDVESGWLSSIQIGIIGWSLNPDARRTLRKAIGRIIQANMLLFEGMGLYQINITQSDQDDYQSYPAAIYQTLTTFSCLADEAVMSQVAPVTGVNVTALATN